MSNSQQKVKWTNVKSIKQTFLELNFKPLEWLERFAYQTFQDKIRVSSPTTLRLLNQRAISSLSKRIEEIESNLLTEKDLELISSYKRQKVEKNQKLQKCKEKLQPIEKMCALV